MPPDEENKISWKGLSWLFSNLKKFLGKYYEREMLHNYENQMIDSMFYELEIAERNTNTSVKFSNFDMASNYLKSIMDGLTTFCYTTSHHIDNQVKYLKFK